MAENTPNNVSAKIGGRSGALIHLTITNKSAVPGAIISATFISSLIRNGEDAFFWLAAPLEVVTPSRSIDAGANIYDLAIQGYRISVPRGPEAIRHFEYLFQMAHMRGLEFIGKLDAADRAVTCSTLRSYLTSIIDLDENDTAASEISMNQAIKNIQNEIVVRTIDCDGVTSVHNLPMKPAWTAEWLANYVLAENKQMLGERIAKLRN